LNHLKNALPSATSTAKGLQMKIIIETIDQGSGCKVWLGETAVSFPSLEDAKTYIAQLEERIEAASHVFGQDDGAPEVN